jgi:hypothetical protein
MRKIEGRKWKKRENGVENKKELRRNSQWYKRLRYGSCPLAA